MTVDPSGLGVVNSENTNPSSEVSNRRKDWLILLWLSLATAILIPIFLETVARWTFYETHNNPCLTDLDSPRGASGVPNSICRLKLAPESPWVVYKYNSCGYRSEPCVPKPKGSYRIAAMGSSFTAGYLVQFDQIYPELLRDEISVRTGRRVDIQNLGMQARVLNNIDQHLNDIWAVAPDLVVWMITSWDIEHADWKTRLDGPQETFQVNLKARIRTLVMLQHFLLQSPSQAVDSYLAQGDHPFLLKASSEAWQRKLDLFDSYVANVTRQAESRGIPVVMGFVPLRAQAIMLSPNFVDVLPKNVDPWKIDRDVRAIAERHGAIYVGLLPDFASVPHVERLFYPVDTHPNAGGHALVSRALARMITDGRIVGLRKNSDTARTKGGG